MNIREKLEDLFRGYIAENNPDLIVKLEGNEAMKRYITDKVNASMELAKRLKEKGNTDSEILKACLSEMVSGLLPSRFQFVKGVIKKHFPRKYAVFAEMGVLTYELIRIIECHEDLFAKHGFGEKRYNEDLLEAGFVEVLFDRFENS
jgi:hypothetical protein